MGVRVLQCPAAALYCAVGSVGAGCLPMPNRQASAEASLQVSGRYLGTLGAGSRLAAVVPTSAQPARAKARRPPESVLNMMPTISPQNGQGAKCCETRQYFRWITEAPASTEENLAARIAGNTLIFHRLRVRAWIAWAKKSLPEGRPGT